VVIHQGDVFWFRFRGEGSEPDGKRPCLVVQHDRFNRSAIRTIVVAAITSNVALSEMPGNVRLRRGEAGLPRASVVNVSQLRTLDRDRLQDRIGALAASRMSAVILGLGLVLGIEHEA
jgi:mRNA interferase MazF